MKASALMCASVLAASLTLSAVAAPAGAAPLTVANNYSEIITKSCNNTNRCLLSAFALGPDNKILTVTRVSCLVIVTKTAVVTQLSAGRHFGSAQNMTFSQFLPLTRLADDPSYARYVANDAVLITLTEFYRPAVLVTLYAKAAYFNVTCTVTGTVADV